MSRNELITLLNETVANHHLDQALALLKGVPSADLAELLQQMIPSCAAYLLEHLPQRAYIFAEFPAKQQMLIAQEMPRQVLAKIVSEMPSDDRADLFKRLDPSEQETLLPALAQAEREDIRRLADYVEGTAGAIMSSDYVTLKPEFTVAQAIEALRKDAPDAETIYQAYIIDEQRHLIGVVSLRELVLAQPETRVAQLMVRDVISARVDDDQDHIAKIMARYDLLALPIVDAQQALVGIITYDDAMDVASEEATEDFLKVGGVNATTKLSIKSAPILQLYQKRVFWLVFLVFGSLLSGIGIAHYEDVIAQHLVLVFFLPLLVGSGGNAGSQSSTLMVRALATGDVQFRDWFYLLGRESLVALCLGGTMAIAVSLLGYVRGDALVALVLAFSMVGIVLMGCLIGMSLPFILNRFGFDPASASAPLVTSICDAMGVLIYLFIASMILF
ncbi:magnesium transporter [Acinetobacter haemolyticus]|uniref:Magnesium transporter MgtE n=1 Tax=Acinetobacter haemolyticus TaxID=29430 RepID=A0A4V1ASH6_ACIHA|nr:magnesium transporter [Acinetobacter haemolyticus]ENW21870.1 magnesium transporter [Acinetobacter haemolyticus NIPH 261]NAR29680.1 magnesium transporter [Acinetobacter haemolyticus]NAR64693.1 magnesium transporter [Acinetobacter haemolyticus]NAR74036.1 magnesium transporter [Acinetobacter haemolyticus]NAR75332.1 magnesium transporter [Acinetobacter haemolyticus]